MLVNLNYRIGLHMNFAQSRFPALVCSRNQNTVATKRVARGQQRGNAIPNSKVFRLMKYLKYKPKKYFSANQQNCLKEPILFQLLVEYKLIYDLLQSLSMIAGKNNWSNAFSSCFWPTSLLYPT